MSPIKTLNTRTDILAASQLSAQFFRDNAAYPTFDDILNADLPGSPFDIKSAKRDSPYLVVAPHAGNIEPGTGELTKLIAGQDISYYSFEGEHEELHVTSTRFQEPILDGLIAHSEWIVTVHGCLGDEGIFVGGQDLKHVSAAVELLRLAGYQANPDRLYPGKHPQNICNRASSGVQFELCRGLREEILSNESKMTHLACTLRSVIKETFSR